MKTRVILTAVLLGLAILIVSNWKGPLGIALGTFAVFCMLFVWVIPFGAYKNVRGAWHDPAMQRGLRIMLGFGLGLIGIVIALLLLPPQWIGWALFAIGAAIIAYYVWQWLR